MGVTHRFLVTSLVVLAACFDPHPPANTPCSSLGECPGSLTCENGLCVTMPGQTPDDAASDDAADDDAATDAMTDAMVDAPILLDTDGDGRLDTMDNCPTIANANQHNEDGDSKGDVCDNCPHLAAPFTDGDGDGVGTACDPHPTVAGDAIARFIPFDVMPNDLVQTGVWTISTATDSAQTTATSARLRIPTIYGKVTAEVGGNVDVAQSTSRELKIVTGWTAANQWHSCCFDDTDGSSRFTFEIENENAGATIILNPPEPTRPTRIDPGAFYLRNTADATANTIACSGNEGAFPITTNASAPALPAGMVEVQVSRVSVSLAYIIVITSP